MLLHQAKLVCRQALRLHMARSVSLHLTSQAADRSKGPATNEIFVDPSKNPTSLEGVQISESCVTRLKQLCASSDTFLRLSVEGGGCSGFQYKFDIDDKMADDDKIFERDGVKVVIDETSLEYVKGSTIDYHTELIRSAFRVVTNPNADTGCSCGASFSIKL